MPATNHFQVTDVFGSKPVQITTGENLDGDKRFRLDVTYIFRGDERRRIWLSRTQLQALHELIGQFLYQSPNEFDGGAPAVTNGRVS